MNNQRTTLPYKTGLDVMQSHPCIPCKSVAIAVCINCNTVGEHSKVYVKMCIGSISYPSIGLDMSFLLRHFSMFPQEKFSQDKMLLCLYSFSL